MSGNPEQSESKPNAYRVAPEQPGDEKGYDTEDPKQSDEGYTAEGVLKRHGEKSKWGRTDQN